jgi:peptidoglycan/LPS O-acetylase OafA/YrhL
MLTHFQAFRYFRGGWEGVDIFFVLSGFLITTLLYEEHATSGRVSLPKFYARRALRLFPALATVLIIWTILFLLFRNEAWLWATANEQHATVPIDPVRAAAKGWLGALTYSTNWLRIVGNPDFPLDHFWTLAIEEQFYVLWPVVLLGLLRLRRPDLITAGLAAASAAWCAAVWEFTKSWQHAGFGTDCQASSLLMGAALALAWKKDTLSWLPDWAVRFAAAFAAISLAGCLLVLDDLVALDFLGFIVLIAGATAALILWVLRTDRRPWLLTNRGVVHVGKLSYALYLWHVLFADWFHAMGLAGAVFGVALSFVAAELSRRLIELPALRRKRRYEVVEAASA